MASPARCHCTIRAKSTEKPALEPSWRSQCHAAVVPMPGIRTPRSTGFSPPRRFTLAFADNYRLVVPGRRSVGRRLRQRVHDGNDRFGHPAVGKRLLGLSGEYKRERPELVVLVEHRHENARQAAVDLGPARRAWPAAGRSTRTAPGEPSGRTGRADRSRRGSSAMRRRSTAESRFRWRWDLPIQRVAFSRPRPAGSWVRA